MTFNCNGKFYVNNILNICFEKVNNQSSIEYDRSERTRIYW